MSILCDPAVAGELKLPNRIVMAPLTRARAGVDRIPNALMRDYYVQRSSAGLICARESAEAILQRGDADSVTFGKTFISNPDLPARFQKGASMNPFDTLTYLEFGSLGLPG